MALDVDVNIEIGEVSVLNGTLVLGLTAEVDISAVVQRYESSTWVTKYSFGPFTETLTGTIVTELSDIGDFSFTPSETGVYRWVLTVDVHDDDDNITSEDSYAYFEVVSATGLAQPLLSASVYTDGTRRVSLIITESDSEATNRIYIRRSDEEFSDTPDFSITGDGSKIVTLGTGSYFAKVISVKGAMYVNGRKDPVAFTIYSTVTEEESESSSGETKNIQNVELQGITNPYYGNQFIGYFIKIPQVGYYQDPETRALKSYVADRINETIRNISLPETAIPMIPISYYAHQNEQYMGVGDGELGQITIRFVLDRYLHNYTSLLNWSYLKYDWTFGGKNPDNQLLDRNLLGTFVVEFLDADEKRSRKLGYKVIIDSLPGISLGVDTPDQIEYEALFRVVDIDTSQFVMGSPLHDRVVIHQSNSAIVSQIT